MENPPLTLIHSLLAMVFGTLHLMEERILSHCLEARSEGGVDKVNVGVVSFLLCMCFELDALTLVAEWFFRATCRAVIASKPPRPNLGPTLIVERFIMHVGGEVRGGTWMKWAEFVTSAAFAAPCVGARGGSCVCGNRWTSSSLWPPSLPGRAASLVLSGSSCCTDPPRAAKTASTLLLWSGFFGGELSSEGMHVPDQLSQLFCTYGPTHRLVRALPSKLIKGEGTRVPPLLGFNSFFLN
jgi:hypothetical protein